MTMLWGRHQTIFRAVYESFMVPLLLNPLNLVKMTGIYAQKGVSKVRGRRDNRRRRKKNKARMTSNDGIKSKFLLYQGQIKLNQHCLSYGNGYVQRSELTTPAEAVQGVNWYGTYKVNRSVNRMKTNSEDYASLLVYAMLKGHVMKIYQNSGYQCSKETKAGQGAVILTSLKPWTTTIRPRW